MNTGGGHGPKFTTTRWTLVVAAGSGSSADADAALAALCDTYWYPLYTFLRRRGHTVEDAQDLTQAFFLHIVENRPFTKADPARGRFRSFLLTSIKNFATNEYHRQRAAKRGGDAPPLSLDVETAEGRFQREPASTETPERVFDRKWALILLERALRRVRDEVLPDKPERFDRLKGYLTRDPAAPSYADAATALGMSEGAVKVAVHRLRERFNAAVREEVADTVASQDQIDDEIRYLLSSVAR